MHWKKNLSNIYVWLATATNRVNLRNRVEAQNTLYILRVEMKGARRLARGAAAANATTEAVCECVIQITTYCVIVCDRSNFLFYSSLFGANKVNRTHILNSVSNFFRSSLASSVKPQNNDWSINGALRLHHGEIWLISRK